MKKAVERQQMACGRLVVWVADSLFVLAVCLYGFGVFIDVIVMCNQ